MPEAPAAGGAEHSAPRAAALAVPRLPVALALLGQSIAPVQVFGAVIVVAAVMALGLRRA